jgi:bifunctional enzyme CysN/CysC
MNKQQDLLRFITCGSVDDGKSTLIGRLLWESCNIFEDQLHALQNESKQFGTQGGEVDFALLVDGLAAEREQGITIDVAYRFFSTEKRKFIVADTPGHEQYTRNMATGASTADLAIILIDATKGILPQTKRHSFIVSLMGIRHIVVAVNKMDLVDFEQKVFQRIVEDFRLLCRNFNFQSIQVIPLSALKGDNITTRSSQTAWYSGPSLMEYLNQVDLGLTLDEKTVFPIQWVNRPDSSFRGYAGTLALGVLRRDDQLRVTSSGRPVRVSRIITMDGDLEEAKAGQAITITLDREVDISRGEVLTDPEWPLETTDQFAATLIWMDEDSGHVGRNYYLKLNSQQTSAMISSIKYKVDVNTLQHEAAKGLELNDIAVCNFALARPLAYMTYEQSKQLGAFILLDKFSNRTVAAGLITHGLRRAQNILKQHHSITLADREKLNGHRGKVVWFTGLSGAGKSTIANALEQELHHQGLRTYILDGDNIRHGLNKDLGFTPSDRIENIRRISEVAKLMMDAGLIVLIAIISPFRQERKAARDLIGEDNFIEVYVSTPLEVCEARDVKGLYKKAREGKLPNLTGIGSPYEVPDAPRITLKTAEVSVEDSVKALIALLDAEIKLIGS